MTWGIGISKQHSHLCLIAIGGHGFQERWAIYGRSCDNCQGVKGPKPYVTSLFVPQSSLFNIFAIDFSGTLPVTSKGKMFLLIGVEHPTGWSVVRATGRTMAEDVRRFMKEQIILLFGAPTVRITDNATCFSLQVLRDFVKAYGTKLYSVLAYVPMSNGRAERMVETFEKAVRRMAHGLGTEWDEALPNVVFRYRRRPTSGNLSPFQLLYAVKPRLPLSSACFEGSSGSTYGREAELFAMLGPHATRAVRQRKQNANSQSISQFRLGQLVLVVYGKVFKSVKGPPFKPRPYGSCMVVEAEQPRHGLCSSTGMRSRKPIHARRLVWYKGRNSWRSSRRLDL